MRRNLLKLVAALAIVAVAALGVHFSAFALSIDPNRNVVARQFSTQQSSYYRFTVNFNDTNISSANGVHFGKLLQNSFINSVVCHVTTAFNAGTTNKFFVGTSNNANEIIASGVSNKSVTEGTPGVYAVTAAASPATLGLAVTSDADHDLVAKYTQTGTAATAGAVTCVLEFMPNNDM